MYFFNKHEYNFIIPKIIEFVELIHAKINWVLVGAQHPWFFFFENNLNGVYNWHWWFLAIFCDTCDIFYIHYCALTSFHDSALLLAAKVCSHSHRVYLFFMHDLLPLCDYSLVSTDFLTNCHNCFTLFLIDLFLTT